MNDADQVKNDKDSVRNTLIVALSVSLTCAVLVSVTSVVLKPRQLENRLYYGGYRSVVQLIQTLDLGLGAEETMRALDVRIIDIDTGAYADGIDPAKFDQREALKDPAWSIDIPPGADVAKLKRRAKRAQVYELRRAGRLHGVVLPLSGAGMWSTVYGYIALKADLNTIAGVVFHEHGETPGIGDKIQDPKWLEQWRGRAIRRDGRVAFEVVKNPSPDARAFQVDAITGATITSEGTGRMVRYWLADHAFRPYLDSLRRKETVR